MTEMLTRIPVLQTRKWRQEKAKEPRKAMQLVKSSCARTPPGPSAPGPEASRGTAPPDGTLLRSPAARCHPENGVSTEAGHPSRSAAPGEAFTAHGPLSSPFLGSLLLPAHSIFPSLLPGAHHAAPPA